MSTTEKILQTMNSWQSGEVIAVRQKNVPGPPPALARVVLENVIKLDIFYIIIQHTLCKIPPTGSC